MTSGRAFTIGVTAQDVFNNVAVASGTQTVLLSTTSAGQFRDNATGNTQITFVTIANGSSSVSFMVKPTSLAFCWISWQISSALG